MMKEIPHLDSNSGHVFVCQKGGIAAFKAGHVCTPLALIAY
jgi:hypothetical protein